VRSSSSSPFVVLLRDIPAEGRRMGLDLDATWTRHSLEGQALPWVLGPCPLKAELELYRTHATEVVMRGTIKGALGAPCSRCAEPARVEMNAPVDMTFVPEEKFMDGAEGGEREMTADEADVATYREEEIDLEDTLRQQLLLALPYAPLCKEDCKGLCAHCGHDLNQGSCSCDPNAETGQLPKPGKDPWAALRNVKL
jgi:uncharacterized protein